MKRDRRAIIEQSTQPASHFTTTGPAWAEFALAFVSIEPLSGRELFAAQQTQAETTHKIILDYISDITTAMRLKVRNALVIGAEDDPDDDQFYRIFHIESIINPLERNKELHLMCVERT